MGKPRNEEILLSIINKKEYDKPAESRIEELLLQLKEVIESSGSSADAYTKSETDALLENKVEKESGKQLSEENYTAEDKEKLDGIDLSEYVKFTDYASSSETGVVSTNIDYGINSVNGVLRTYPASDSQVRGGNNVWQPMVSKHVPVFMDEYGIPAKTTIPEMQEQIDELSVKSMTITDTIKISNLTVDASNFGFYTTRQVILSAYTANVSSQSTGLSVTPYHGSNNRWLLHVTAPTGSVVEGDYTITIFYIDIQSVQNAKIGNILSKSDSLNKNEESEGQLDERTENLEQTD